MRPKLTASSPTARRSIASVSVPSSDPADLSTYTAPSPPSPPSAAHIRKLKGAMLANLNTNELACLLARIFLRCPEAYDVLLEQWATEKGHLTRTVTENWKKKKKKNFIFYIWLLFDSWSSNNMFLLHHVYICFEHICCTAFPVLDAANAIRLCT